MPQGWYSGDKLLRESLVEVDARNDPEPFFRERGNYVLDCAIKQTFEGY